MAVIYLSSLKTFFQSQDSVVDASSNLGVDGDIIIKSPDETVSNSLTEMPESLLSVMQLVSQQCDVKTRKDISSLVLVGRDGLPPSSNDFMTERLPIAADNVVSLLIIRTRIALFTSLYDMVKLINRVSWLY